MVTPERSKATRPVVSPSEQNLSYEGELYAAKPAQSRVGDLCFGCSFHTPRKCQHTGDVKCMASNRSDGKDIIWVSINVKHRVEPPKAFEHPMEGTW